MQSILLIHILRWPMMYVRTSYSETHGTIHMHSGHGLSAQISTYVST